MPALQRQLKGSSIDENEEGKCQGCEKWKKEYETSEKRNKELEDRIEELMKKDKPSCSKNTFRRPIQRQGTVSIVRQCLCLYCNKQKWTVKIDCMFSP